MKKLSLLLLLSLAMSQAFAVDGTFIEYGEGDMVNAYRVGALWDWNKHWMTDGGSQITGFWEATLGRWRGNKPNDNNQTITEISITPVFRIAQNKDSGILPYLEGGFVGLHLISPTTIYSDRKLGCSFQFGNHIGFGVRFGEHRQYDLAYRYQHMSNGDIKKPNQGVNLSQIHFIYHF
jgi:lipid A 3-O-deacylase